MTALPLKRILQIPAFCGPATLAMLLSQYNLEVSQVKIAGAGNALKDVLELGMRIDQLALATRRIAPNLRMWAKHDATFEDLNKLINIHGLAVGVEWQGLWEEDWEEDDIDGALNADDPGHYSVIVSIDMEKRELMLRDPSTYFQDKDRTFAFENFEKLWFDANEVGKDAPEESRAWSNDVHVVFVVMPREKSLPEALGLKKVRVPQEVSIAAPPVESDKTVIPEQAPTIPPIAVAPQQQVPLK